MAFLFDWSKMETEEYTHDVTQGSVVQLGERNYIMLSGTGDEHSKAFMTQAKAMLALGQYLTEAPQHHIEINDFRNYVHYPLNVSWVGNVGEPHGDYQMLMKHPNFMPAAAVEQAIDQLAQSDSVVGQIKYGRFEEGLEAQIGHVGLPDATTVQQLKAFVTEIPFAIDETEGAHRELYLNDITTLPDTQWQTILRQRVTPVDQRAADQFSIAMN